MIFKEAQIEDIPSLIILRIEYFKEVYMEFTDDDAKILNDNMKNYLMKHLNKDCFAIIAMDGDKAVSSGIVNIFEKVPNKRVKNGMFAEIYGVFTKSEYRRNGYATGIIKRIIELMNLKGVSFIELEASEDGLGVYEKCGFVISENPYTRMNYFFSDSDVWRKNDFFKPRK